MFYGQCWKCGERWELGTASTCKCPDETEPYKFTDNSTEVLRLSKEGIWANPEIPADEAAKLVLAAMEWNIKVLVDKAVADERERIAKVCEEFARKWLKIHCDSNLYYSSTLKAHQDFCALQAAIRARSNT